MQHALPFWLLPPWPTLTQLLPRVGDGSWTRTPTRRGTRTDRETDADAEMETEMEMKADESRHDGGQMKNHSAVPETAQLGP